MRTPPELVADSVRGRLISDGDVLDGLVTVSDESRSNHVLRIVLADQPIAYVKQRGLASQLDGEDVVGAESKVLECLKDVDLAPKMITILSEDAVWVEAIRGTNVIRLRGQVRELAAICFSWGGRVAQLHNYRQALHRAPAAARPWALRPDELPRSMQGADHSGAFGLVLEALRSDRSLRSAAAQAHRLWTATHWIHGDLSASNVIMVGDPFNGDDRELDVGRRSSSMIRFIDFEAAGLGDPGWDVATVLDTLAWLAPSWNTPAEPLVERFLDGYRAADGPGHAHSALQAVRAVMTAWQVAAQQTAGGQRETVEGQVSALLDRARGYASAVAVAPLYAEAPA